MHRISDYITKPGETPGDKILDGIKSIQFNNVTLSLEEKQILTNLNFTLEKGHTYGIYGPSGSGKTTILNSICGFIKPEKGSILINNTIPLHEFANINDHIGLIEKENQLFFGSIKENIIYNTNHSPEAFDEIIKVSGLAELLQKLSEKENMIVNSSGQKLSDGQKQRISIARALLKNPSVYIFDEATSTLDLKLEKEIIQKTRALRPDCILILISHRMKSLHELCDTLIEIGDKQAILH